MRKQSLRVLVVEDDALVRTGLALTLEDANLQVFEAGNAQEALALLEEVGDVDVVVTDVDMPGPINGLTLATLVHVDRPSTRIVVISGLPIHPSELPPGVTILQKPFTLGGLTDTVRGF